MKPARTFGLLLTPCALLLLFSGLESGGPKALVRIAKDSPRTAAILEEHQVDVRQELASCFLAFVEARDLRLLKKHWIRFKTVAQLAPQREFFVVPVRAPEDLTRLRAVGRAAAVEAGTAVFWTETGFPAARLPAGLPRKSLSLRPVWVVAGPTTPPAQPSAATVAADPFVESLVSLVSSSALAAGVQSLQDFQTRYASTPNCETAGTFLYGAFAALGLDDVRYESFSFAGSYTSRNVVAEITGQTYPDDIVVLCAHYDSTSPAASRQTLAPGADDNASGTAAVLEAARVLAAFPLDFTVRFIAFSAEEWGLYGSRAHAAAARLRGERIVAVINLDMIAYANVMPEDLQVIVNPASDWLAERFLDAAADYGPLGATKTVDASFVYSDHSPFWDQGYPALLAIEDEPLTNPYYHQTTDTLDRLNSGFFTSASRASLGLLAELAQPVKDGHPRTPVVLGASPVVYSSLFSSLKVVRLTWTGQSDADGYNVYRAPVSHLGYSKLNALPVAEPAFVDDTAATDADYYYVVTAVGATGLESNRSREVRAGSGALTAATGLAALGFIRPGGWL